MEKEYDIMLSIKPLINLLDSWSIFNAFASAIISTCDKYVSALVLAKILLYNVADNNTPFLWYMVGYTVDVPTRAHICGTTEYTFLVPT